MAGLRVERLESVAALRDAAAQWDDLWHRSDSALPTGRAELIADWVERLAPEARLICLLVRQDDRLVSALPMIGQRLARVIRVGALPRNDWCFAGDLLLDQSADVPQVLCALAAEFKKLPWPLVRLDMVPVETFRWQHMLAALNKANLAFDLRKRFCIGWVNIERLNRDWEAYEQAWSGNHRRHMRKAVRRAEEQGGVELDLCRPESTGELESLLREGFEVEHRSWKGTGGTSLMACPEQWTFYLSQASKLAEAGQLELAFLRHRGRAIAFEYGWSARGTYFTPKVGFDSEYSSFSAGQLLRRFVLKDAFARPDRKAIDYLGPLSEATAKWATDTYTISRLLVETGKVGGRSMLSAYQRGLSPLRRMLRGNQAEDEMKIVELEAQQRKPLSASSVGA